MKELLKKLKSGEISQRSFIATIKKSESYTNEVINETLFLNEYNPDILERLYYIINDIHETIKCPYCQNKAKWTGRINEGYKTTCCSKDCESKRISKQKQGLTNISENRDKQFIDWQSNIDEKEINDELIKDNIKYDKHIDLLTNPFIISYLENRFKDSSSLLESYQRIVMGVEEKPKCPVCGKHVVWIGKQSKLYTRYCSDKCSANSKETQQKKKQTQLKNWGTENCYNSEKYKAKLKKEYGVEYVAQRKDVIEKRKQTFLSKYGVEYVMQNEDIKDKMWQTCKEHMSFNTSNEETQIALWLTELGYKFEQHVKTEKYPFNCDFYLPDYDIYLEYQGSQFHKGYSYLGTPEDIDELNKLIKKRDNKIAQGLKPQEISIIDTWSKRDVKKRETALTNNVRLLEIYICKNKEELKYQLELFINCINYVNIFNYNKDYLHKSFNELFNLHITDLSSYNKYIANDIIKRFQCLKFYEYEISIYANNPILRRKLIQNRCKYLNKKENELTVSEIFNGFKISGVHYGYSHFNPAWTNWFVNKFNIKTIYDPCGGWGHHQLGMLSCNKIIYNDINEDIYKGVCEMRDYFHIDNLICHLGDALTYIPEKTDAWFMCPPYYNLEDYGNKSFESIDEYKEFLNKIFDIWFKFGGNLFGLVIRDDYFKLLDNMYKNLVIEYHKLNINKSHLIKNKRHKEIFYIFKK